MLPGLTIGTAHVYLAKSINGKLKLTCIGENSNGVDGWQCHFIEVDDGSDSGKAADADVVKERLVFLGVREHDD